MLYEVITEDSRLVIDLQRKRYDPAYSVIYCVALCRPSAALDGCAVAHAVGVADNPDAATPRG